MGIWATETFTDVDGTALSAHTPDAGGGTWAAIPTVPIAQIWANGCGKTTSGVCGGKMLSIAGSNDQWVQATVTTAPGPGDATCVILRCTGTTKQFYAAGFNGWDLGAGLRIFLWSGIAITLISAAGSVNPGDVLYFEAIGTRLRFLVNGVVVLTTTDSTLAEGAPGVYLAPGTGSIAWMDTWSAGDIPKRTLLAQAAL